MFSAGSAARRTRTARRVAPPGSPATPSVYSCVVAKDTQLDDIAKALRDVPAVEAAYIKPAAEPPINRMTASGAAPPRARTPDFTARQNYLAAAPGGIDAHFAWTLAGGKGKDVTIIDVEGEWRASHRT